MEASTPDPLSVSREAADKTMSRVLVIEDDPGHRELVTAFLSGARYEVQVAENGRLGLSAATQDPPDLVLLDLYLPDMDGYEVCRRLRQGARTRRTPIVIITVSDDPALNRRAYAAGAQACIPKPLRQAALLATLEAVLAGVGRRASRPEGQGQQASPSAPQRGGTGWKALEAYRGHQVWVRPLGGGRWVAALTPVSLSGSPKPAGSPPQESILPAAFDSEAAAVEAARRHLDGKDPRPAQ